eukprot:CAMPEP_0116006816 /NCGR_PEP_ID=MMETSP0321-20121206/1948_1 /TAXON_ID=163516 /ORGANISM="Leptocylindrus danicus var. danicus, Strain B650" /LENGTH=606 /DNA_ID=CAMNT_0003475431 /DNA_START=29 /DNA_END=1849 /DNA_ORIENTATION=+
MVRRKKREKVKKKEQQEHHEQDACKSFTKLLHVLNSPALIASTLLEAVRMIEIVPPRSITCAESSGENVSSEDDDNSSNSADIILQRVEQERHVQDAKDYLLTAMHHAIPQLADDNWRNSEERLAAVLELGIERCVRDISSKVNRHDTSSWNSMDNIRRREALLEERILSAKNATLVHVKETLYMLIVSRTPHDGSSKKIHQRQYEVYGFDFPVQCIFGMAGLKNLKLRIKQEFGLIYYGTDEMDSLEDVRVHACTRKFTLGDGNANYDLEECSAENPSNHVVYIQINVGDIKSDSSSSTSSYNAPIKRRKRTFQHDSHQFIAVIKPETSVLALAAQMLPSKLSMTPYVLAALSAALCSIDGEKSGDNNYDLLALGDRRIGQLEGSDPHALLHAALSSANKATLGRFAKITETDDRKRLSSDAFAELDTAMTSELVNREDEQKRLDTSTRYGRSIAAQAASIDAHSRGSSSLIATGIAGVVVDHDAAKVRAALESRDKEMGNVGNCSKVEKICWKWSGFSKALPDIRGKEGDRPESSLTRFKCGVVFEGKDVFSGIQALLAAGIAKPPLPDFIRDAPMSSSSMITVNRNNLSAILDAEPIEEVRSS